MAERAAAATEAAVAAATVAGSVQARGLAW